jgi:hypothetical protein
MRLVWEVPRLGELFVFLHDTAHSLLLHKTVS